MVPFDRSGGENPCSQPKCPINALTNRTILALSCLHPKQIDPDLNVIVITGYPDSEILDRILQVSPVTVLKKPLKVQQLYQTVKILGHNVPSWGAEQQNSRLLVKL
jgi:DNA-binding NtrC family response regulator